MSAEVIEFRKPEEGEVIIFDLRPGETLTGRFFLRNTWDKVEAFTTSHGRLLYVLHEWESYEPNIAEKIA